MVLFNQSARDKKDVIVCMFVVVVVVLFLFVLSVRHFDAYSSEK